MTAADVRIPTPTPEHTGIIPGHKLSSEGAPFSAKGRRTGRIQSTGGTGWAKCHCGALSETALPSAAARRRWHRQHKAAIIAATRAAQTAGDAAYDDATQPDREPPTSTWDGALPGSPMLEGLPPTLTDGLTVWGSYGGAQIRLETPLLADDHGNLAYDENGAPQVAGPPIGCLYVAFRPDAVRSDNEDLAPYRLDLTEARALRDLLNIATARGVL